MNPTVISKNSPGRHTSFKPTIGFALLSCLLTLGAFRSASAQIPQGDLTIRLNDVASGLTSPLTLTHAGDGSGRLFVVDQVGKIRVIEEGVLLPTPFLDISSKLVTLGAFFDERGLLGLAFHPNYQSNGKFYVNYSAPRAGNPSEPCNNTSFNPGCHSQIIAEYQVSADPNLADPSSEIILLDIDEPQFNHNGGHIAFGQDGNLYISLGDGGGAHDGLADVPPSHGLFGHGQNIETALGSVLRINVDGGSPYSIPADNPFIGVFGLDEIYAYGFRNPYRFSFDRGGSNELFLADVGQGLFEELNSVSNGGNYGWVIREGQHCFDPFDPGTPPASCPDAGLIDPFAEYDHGDGLSIIGGYVYRGTANPSLDGTYIFGDFSRDFGPSGRLFYLDSEGDRSIIQELQIGPNNDPLNRFLFGFGEDEDGELYVLTSTNLAPNGTGGQVWRLGADKTDIELETVADAIQGEMKNVDISYSDGVKEIGAFDFLIEYDPSALTPVGASEGDIYEALAWEYFTYRFGTSGICASGCPSGKMRIIGIAETNNGANHPLGFALTPGATFASIQFLVSNDRTLECQFAPIRFCWYDCGDNGLASPSGDTLFASCRVYDYPGTGSQGPSLDRADITTANSALPTLTGLPGDCIVDPEPGKPPVLRDVNFLNGGISIICADSIDARGDINLNGLPYEISDEVMFTEYFISGLSAFGDHIDGSIAASEVNNDGVPLTVADLVFLLRVIVGDQAPLPKATAERASIAFSEGVISTNAILGGALFIFDGSAEVALLQENLKLLTRERDGKTFALVIPLVGPFQPIAAGPIVSSSIAPSSVELSDPLGRVIESDNPVKPEHFELHQNYPNPFNPRTVIRYTLLESSSVALTIYNLLGQEIVSYDQGEQDAGDHSVSWDGVDREGSAVGSGVYFYKLSAGDFTASRKMTLLK